MQYESRELTAITDYIREKWDHPFPLRDRDIDGILQFINEADSDMTLVEAIDEAIYDWQLSIEEAAN